MSGRICGKPSCQEPITGRGSMFLCLKCSDAANIVVRKMTAQGHTAAQIGLKLGISESNVFQRRAFIKDAGCRPEVSLAVIGIEDIKPRDKLPRVIRCCPWPTHEDPSRDLHTCSRPSLNLECASIEHDNEHTAAA